MAKGCQAFHTTVTSWFFRVAHSRHSRGCAAAAVLRRAIRTQARALCTTAYVSGYTFPGIARVSIRCDYPQPNRECSAGTPGWDFASILGSATPAVVSRQGIDMSTKPNCPQCRSIETSRSHRRGTVERYLLAVIGVRPFRCLNCDARFYSFARFDEETSLNNKAA